MSPSMADCTKTATGVQEITCLPCDIPALCRNNYYRGKLLTERDFTDEQRYGMDKLRLHNQRLHGWGVVCGLIVKPHPYCPEKRLVVGEGFAIDDCGREIRLLTEDYTLLPQPAPGSSSPTVREPPAGSGGGREVGHDAGQEGARDSDGDRARGREEDCGCDEPVPIDLYLCIRYAECETEFAPAPFDDCSCATSSQKPNRVCEGYVLELYQQKPEFWDHAKHGECEAGECCQYFRDARECCPGVGACPCLPLAVIRNFVPGTAVTEEQIDNWCSRRELTSTETLDQVVRCILTKLPTEELTRIEDTNWEHDRRMLCREFMEEYVGSADRPRGFRIEFSHKVHSGQIDTRSYQATVVFVPENPSEPRHMQIAPARVEREHDETGWARLCIDAGYARRHLEGKDFDLFLTLKCDVIRDHHGHSVDGNFLGHLPTGDHIQGGTFESWVRVRMRSRNE
jgi:hypothetical protein